MAYKRITKKQRKNGMCWCDFCQAKGKSKIQAKWVGWGNLFCDAHYQEEVKSKKSELTMADEMTWNKL